MKPEIKVDEGGQKHPKASLMHGPLAKSLTLLKNSRMMKITSVGGCTLSKKEKYHPNYKQHMDH